MIFTTRVNGIPCKCEVTSFSPYVPMRITGSGQGDVDPPEEAEFEFNILDRRGREAPWLERYVTPTVIQNLFEEASFMHMAEYYDDFKEPDEYH